MKIALVGAGIIGVTTAWELACDGHEVHVFDRRSAAAQEASFAPAGLIAPGCMSPWPVAGAPLKVLQALLTPQRAFRLRWPLPAGAPGWLRQWLRACQPQAHLESRARLQRLAFYSRTRMQQLTQHSASALSHERRTGYLIVLRGGREHKLIQPVLEMLQENGSLWRAVDADEARRIEPALSTETALAGAVHLPHEEVANCRQFTLLLKQQAQAQGVQFFFNCEVQPLSQAAPSALRIEGRAAPTRYDAVVLCAGASAAPLLQTLGLRLPLMPLHGYSISVPLREPHLGPRSIIRDERHQVLVARLGQRVRVAGGLELGGPGGVVDPTAVHRLYQVLHDWFPGVCRPDTGIQQWMGACPMLPDGSPIIGASGVPGVWLNLGHGAHGWALACGSARLLADLMSQRRTAIDLPGVQPRRVLTHG